MEIERKFLVADPVAAVAEAVGRHTISQGYLCRVPERTVRVRLRDGEGFITVKGRNHGAERQEWEYAVPLADVRGMLSLCEAPILHKTRYIVPASGGLKWEVDSFDAPCCGLWLAEIELPTADTPFDRPRWLGEEVTDDPRYYNSVLCHGGAERQH